MPHPNRLPLLTAAQVTSASTPDPFAVRQMDYNCAPVCRGRLFADQAYCDASWTKDLRKNLDELLTPRKKKKYDVVRSTDSFSSWVSAWCQPVESFFIGFIPHPAF